MVRKVAIVVLTLTAVGMLAAGVSGHCAAWAGEWSWRSRAWLGMRLAIDHRYIVIAHDKVLPGQVPDPEFGVRLAKAFREAGEAGKLTPTEYTMDEAFAHSGMLGVRWGQGLFRDEFGLLTKCLVVLVPLWMAGIGFGVYPTVVLIYGPVRRFRRRRKGLCFKCGYDLTGNLSGSCPECGTVVEKKGQSESAGINRHGVRDD